MAIIDMLPQAGGAAPSVLTMTVLNTGTTGQRTLTGSATATSDGYAYVVGVVFQASGTNQTVSCTHNGTGQTALRETYIDGERVKGFFFSVKAGDTIGVTCTTPNTGATVYASSYHIYQLAIE